jgi:hypothetical protein
MSLFIERLRRNTPKQHLVEYAFGPEIVAYHMGAAMRQITGVVSNIFLDHWPQCKCANHFRTVGLVLAMLLCVQGAALAQLPPHIFFSDLVSGPNTGGENNNGAYVTLYGTNFGSNPTVTVGGGQALVKLAPAPWLWYQKMTIQLGPNAQTGDIVITGPGGTSNGTPFTVSPGSIYFVATTGNDSNSGAFGAPWRTLVHAVQTGGAAAGSIIYAMDGVAATTDDGQGWGAALTLRSEWCQGTSASPTALIGYPGATVTIGDGNTALEAIRGTDYSASGGPCGGNWVFAEINFRGLVDAEGPSTNWRIIGNDVSDNANANSASGLGAELATYTKWLGNFGHNMNLGNTNRLTQSFYLGTDSNHSEIGWNTIQHTGGRAGLQIHSSPVISGTGYTMYDISIHDNVVHDTAEEGMIIDTVDPSKGPIQVYNNVVYNCGKDGNSNGAIYRAVSSDFDTSHGAGSGTIDFYNNTVFNYQSGPAFGASFEVHVNQSLIDRLRNNLVYDSLSSGQPYVWQETASSSNYTVCSNSDTANACPWLTGSNNLFYGGGALPFPNLVSNSLNVNPLFVNLAGDDAHLQAGSPAATAGSNTGQAADIDGVPLPQGAGYPIGAYAYVTGGTSRGVRVSISPPSATMLLSGSQQFTATVTGSSNTAVRWSMSPNLGTLSSSGYYTAPTSLTSSQTVTITATSVADPASSASATVMMSPVTVSVNPSSASLGPSQQQQFTATVGNSTNTAVMWTLTPAVGTLSASGLYMPPSSISSTQTVTVTATSMADTTKSASATITLNPPVTISVTVAPASVSLGAAGQQQFTATVSGASNTAVTWTLSPLVGTLSASGLYTAPSSISSAQTVTVTATSMADTTKSASATITLNLPVAISVTVAPTATSVSAAGQQQFTATVNGPSNTAVTWTLSPVVGTLSSSGLYTAPSSIPAKQTVTVTATSSTSTASATVTLTPPNNNGFSVSFRVVNTGLQVSWTAPAGRSGDNITLASPGAPDWWYLSSKTLKGTSGIYTVSFPKGIGQYEFRYYLAGEGYKLAAKSGTYASGVSGFSLNANQTNVTQGSPMVISFTAPAGRPGGWSGDWLVLTQSGTGADQPVWTGYPLGATSGTLTLTAPSTPGTYQFWYMLAGNGYISAAQAGTITVQ